MNLKKLGIFVVGVLAAASLAGCSSLPDHGNAKIVDGFGSDNTVSSTQNGGSSEGGDSQYGQTQTQGVPGSANFQGDSIYAQNAQVGDSDTAGSVSGSQASVSTLGGSQQSAQNVSDLPKVIHFAFDSYSINGQAQSVLAPNVTYLIQHPSEHLLIAGHTDPRGSQEYNFHLGQRRANAVLHYLLAQGVSKSQLCTVSYGELRPAASPADFNGDWKKAYSMDRRAVLKYGQTCEGQKRG